MNYITRRNLLTTSALVPIVACAAIHNPAVPNDTLSQGISFAQQIATALNDLLTGLPQLSQLVGTSTFAQIQKWVGIANTAVNNLNGVTSTSSAASIVSQLINAASSILPLIGVTLPPPFDLLLPAVATLLPVLGNIFGVAIPSVAKSSRYARIQMTPDQAVTALRQIHASVR